MQLVLRFVGVGLLRAGAAGVIVMYYFVVRFPIYRVGDQDPLYNAEGVEYFPWHVFCASEGVGVVRSVGTLWCDIVHYEARQDYYLVGHCAGGAK